MTKVNFKQIVLKDIEGNDVVADFSKQIGNQLYMQGQNIEECELGKHIYFADGEVEINEKDVDAVKRIIAGYSYVAREAICEAMKGE